MSHTVQQNAGICFPFRVTIGNYVSGGETFSLSDIGTLSLNGIVLGLISPSNNSLGVVLVPILNGAVIRLYQVTAGGFAEIPSTNALNAVLDAIFFV